MTLGTVVATLALAVAAADSPPRRIVSVVPAVTEMLYAIGAGPRVVGVSTFDHFPPDVERLPRVGGLLDPDVERILSLRPDLVITYSTQLDLQEQMRRASIPTFTYTHGGLANIPATIRDVGRRVGRAPDADRVVRAFESEVAAVRDRVSGRPRPRVLLVFARDPDTLRNIYASGGYGFLHDMLGAAGGTNVFGAIARESALATTEQILAAAPEVIIEVRAGADPSAERLRRDMAIWNTLASLPAVRSGHAYALVGGEFVIPGPRVSGGVARIAQVRHPRAFE